MHCRLLIDPPASGAWNMAVDEALVDAAVAGAPLVLRFYGWTPGTLSLGYFQHAAERMNHRPSLSCPLVRRASGGGAILHDRELTYALVVPAEHPLARQTAGLYRAAHGALIHALAAWGVSAEMFHCGVACAADADEAGPQTGSEAFLCFHRRGEGDLVVAGSKVAGSAQRRRQGAVLQHGSALLAASSAAPELPGLAELGGRDINPDDLRQAWLERLAEQLGLTFEPGSLSEAERQAAVELQRSKYSAAEWTYRR
jgi:lipoate-protein ligase A